MATGRPRTVAGAPAIGFDIGGTNLRGAVVTDTGEIIARAQRPTPNVESELEDTIADTVFELRAEVPEAEAVGLAVAGFLDAQRRRVRFAPHLPWRDADVADRLEQRLGHTVTLEHDANSAAWGEYRFGAAQGANTWVLFALGTGIGGAMMHNGEMFRGAYGTAPEFGHLRVVAGGRECSCGKRGCLERYCSGTALAYTARERAASGGYSSDLAELALRPGSALTGTAVMTAAAASDPLGCDVLDEFSEWLGQGLALTADVFDPELIVIGGGLVRDHELYLDRARAVFAESITGAGHRPVARVAPAQLVADAGLIGAASCAMADAQQRSA
ncbi:ROK family protein [Corynebacterium sp. TAE3-ERU12]|uniref:ROK family protein n=1 Tax=Corynebacterium sp. TAE3-ERU12 TaxID=2849491 RepID=UPI001C43A85B|nr:ROK family protein [Corynebacterium sp. TAE3-ERU12]MBV7296245.1 ROK family protein [Corynebacterium sp. TAE3-ERU12]